MEAQMANQQRRRQQDGPGWVNQNESWRSDHDYPEEGVFQESADQQWRDQADGDYRQDSRNWSRRYGAGPRGHEGPVQAHSVHGDGRFSERQRGKGGHGRGRYSGGRAGSYGSGGSRYGNGPRFSGYGDEGYGRPEQYTERGDFRPGQGGGNS